MIPNPQVAGSNPAGVATSSSMHVIRSSANAVASEDSPGRVLRGVDWGVPLDRPFKEHLIGPIQVFPQ